MMRAPGPPFHDLAADQALYNALKTNLHTDIPVLELDCTIDDPPFAGPCARELV
jgi:uncharacterized protein (UPF0261 family)